MFSVLNTIDTFNDSKECFNKEFLNSNVVIIRNANIILPNAIINGSVLIEDGKIAGIIGMKNPTHFGAFSIDAKESFLMPGMIDMHSDAIEKEIQPRPKTLFPVKMAFYELEKKLAGNGITTMYHSLCLSDEWGVRDYNMVLNIIDSINDIKRCRSMLNHKIHIRYELTYLDGIKILENLVQEKRVDLVSYMDHSPGQGQFKDPEAFKYFTMSSYGTKEGETEEFIARTLEKKKNIDWGKLEELGRIASLKGISLASHDDDTSDKVETLLKCKGDICEFPINIETAIYAKSKGLHVCVGAPNIIRGRSHNNNMRAIDAIRSNSADIICSDYLPSAMLPAVFHIAMDGKKLEVAVNMVTYNPAKALGIEEYTGSLEEGKDADLLIVELYNGYPIVRKTLVGGKLVYQGDYINGYTEGVEKICS